MCVDRTSEADLIDVTNCVWQLPYCEFSTWDEDGNPAPPSSSTSSSSSSSGGGGGGVTTTNKTTTTEEEAAGEGEAGEAPITGDITGEEAGEIETIGEGRNLTWLWWVVGALVVIAIVVVVIIKRMRKY